ncbi:MAG TPA: hypothetical protein VGN95_25235 [Pyrinomonadaceae bacterium]|nr:hypothetical protein [Pyrinomonadaceae bacterium]
MAFNYPYQTLNIEELRHLTAKDNTTARKALIDCLAMLQEILLDASSSPVRPFVQNSSMAASIIEETLSNFPQIAYVVRSAYDTTSEATRQAEADEIRQRVIREIRKNKETALELRQEYLSPSGPPNGATSTSEAANFIETFLTTLATQYDNLRYPNTQAMPAS